MNPVPSGSSNTAHTPIERYSALVEVEPTVFAEAITAEAAARGVFATWVGQSPVAPEDPNALVRDVNLERRHWARLETEIAARSATWREKAYNGSEQVFASSPPTGVADLWVTSEEELRRVSRHICRCGTCDGGGQVTCPECGGQARVQCSNCQGTGKAYGYAKNGSRRLMNCRVCSGQLELQCPSCEAGTRQCANCGGSGRRERWLEMAETRRVEVRGGPAEHLPQAFSWSKAAEDASRDEICVDAMLIGQTDVRGALSDAQVANLAPMTRIGHQLKDLQPALRNDERIERQSLTVFEIPSVVLTYGLPGTKPATVRFEGLRMLAPPVNSDESFALRARRLWLTRRVLAGIVLGVPLVYLARGEYFRNGLVAVLAVCLGAVAFAMYRLVRSLMLYGIARARVWAWITGIGAVILGGLVVQVEPSVRAARRFLSSDHLDAAKQELVALGGPERPDHAELWASLHLAIAKKATDPEIIRTELTQIGTQTPQRQACARHLCEVVEIAAHQQLAAKQWQHAEALLALVAPVLADELRGDPALGQLDELRALVQDQAFEGCATDLCRLKTARKALSFATSPEPLQRVNASRENVLVSLSYQPNRDDQVLARLKRLRDIEQVATELGGQEGDSELAGRVHAAQETVQRERDRVPLIGADAAVLGELIGAATDRGASILRFEDKAVSLYANMRSGRCVGTYIVGSSNTQRALNDPARSKTAARLLSQSFGSEVPLPEQSGGLSARNSSISRSRIGVVPLVARWNGTALIELRIGEAQP